MNPAIVIPVYKKELSETEKRSVINTLRVFSGYSVIMVCPDQLSVQWYEQLPNPGLPLKFIRFSNVFFSSINGYNRLLLTQAFYRSFSGFSHVLICQTDAWVFGNQLEYWMSQPYDYFGSPIITAKIPGGVDFMPQGGNGGFSLRRVKSHIRVLKKLKIMESPGAVVTYYRRFHSGPALWFRFPFILFRMLGYRNNSKYYTRHFGANEDMFWSKKAMLIDTSFKPAPVEMEIAFAFEKEPSALYALNQNRLPFGCHAWEKYEPEFWREHIYRTDMANDVNKNCF